MIQWPEFECSTDLDLNLKLNLELSSVNFLGPFLQITRPCLPFWKLLCYTQSLHNYIYFCNHITETIRVTQTIALMTENNVSLNALFQFSFWYISLWLSSKRQLHDEIEILSGKVTKRFPCVCKSLHNIFMMIRHREQIPQSETLVRSWLVPFKGIQDSLGFWIPLLEFWIPGTEFRTLSVELGFRIPWAVSRIPKSMILDPTNNYFPDSGIEIPLYGRGGLRPR